MRRPAPFSYYSATLSRLLSDAWRDASAGWRDKLVRAFREGDEKAIKELLRQGRGIGAHARAKVRTPLSATLLAAQRKAAAHWDKVLPTAKKKFAKAAPPSILTDPSRREKLRQLKLDQIEAFVEAFPERILAPETNRLIDLMSEYETAREIDLAEIADRAERMLSSEAYWDQLSNVEVSRLWHGDGVALASEQKIERLQIVAVLDDHTCDVCVVMHGNEVIVSDALQKYEDEGNIEDPDKYVEAWAFPRFADVQLMDNEAITASGYLPPFHPGGPKGGGCRCSLRPLY